MNKAFLYDILLAPVVTEKTTTTNGQYFFYVRNDATKPQIKMAVEEVFGVKVKAVNTLIRKGKNKQFRGHRGRQSDKKRAMITLVPGQNLDVGVGA